MELYNSTREVFLAQLEAERVAFMRDGMDEVQVEEAVDALRPSWELTSGVDTWNARAPVLNTMQVCVCVCVCVVVGAG